MKKIDIEKGMLKYRLRKRLNEEEEKKSVSNGILSFVNKMEGWKTAVKSLHWNANNMSQHKLCDDIADRIADFQDQVSEVWQSIDGNLAFNKLKGTEYKITNLQKFVSDVITDAINFYHTLESKGDKYIGMRSDFESFISDMQRNLYLVKFTIKEDKIRANREFVLENGRMSYTLNENELRALIDEAISRVIG